MIEVEPLSLASSLDEENGKIEVNDVYSTNGDSSRNSTPTPQEERDVIAEIFFQTRSLQRQHNLAYVHYRNLEWFLHSTPLIILSLTSGILAFLASTGGQKDGSFEIPGTNSTYTPDEVILPSSLFSSGTRQNFAIIVGVLSFVQLAIQKLGENWNFGSRSDMHLQVATGLERLFNKLMVEEKIWIGSHGEEEYKTASADIQRWQEVFEQCLISCSSPIPLQLRQAFKMLESQLQLYMLANSVINNYDIHDRQQRQLLYSHAFNELFHEITDSRWWPLFFIKPKKAVTNVMRNFDKNYGR